MCRGVLGVSREVVGLLSDQDRARSFNEQHLANIAYAYSKAMGGGQTQVATEMFNAGLLLGREVARSDFEI